VDPCLIDAVVREVEEQDVEQGDLRRLALMQCMQKLKTADRDLINQRYAVGATVRSIAMQCGRSENALSQSLGRIRRMLADCVNLTLRQTAVGDAN